jgi:cytochrome c biogenesis protein CcdA
MAISIFAFTLLLRASTVLIDVDPTFWEVFAGGIIFTQGIITLFPEIWDKFSVRIGINRRSSELVNDAAKKEGVLGSVFTGIALGPIFSSCSPTYGFIIGAVFQTTPSVAIIYLVTYIIGLSTLLLTIAVLGQNVVSKLKWGTNPHGIFKRLIALLFIILGWSIMFGIHKDVEEFIINNLPFLDATAIDRSLLDRAR